MARCGQSGKGHEVMINRVHRSKGNVISFERIGSVEKSKTHLLFRQQCLRALCHAFLSFVVGLTTLLGMSGCSTNSAKTNTSMTPTVSLVLTQAPPPSLTVGGTATVSAMVNDDIANA